MEGHAAPDIDKLVSDLERRADEAEELSKEIHATQVTTVGNPDALIKAVAANLAETGKAIGLPSQDASQFEEQIKLHQRASETGE